MPDIKRTETKAQYEWLLQRGQSSATRTFSVDGVNYNEGGKSAAVAFRDIFTGGASNPLSIIDPTKFWQPTGWRDSDVTEDEWETKGCNLTLVKTDYWHIDGGSSATGARNLRLIGAEDDMDTEVSIIYDGLVQNDPPIVNLYANGQWTKKNLEYADSGSLGRRFILSKTSGMSQQQASIYIPASNDLPAVYQEFVILN